MPLPSDLKHFQPAEFKHPELVDAEAAYFLDEVRDRYGHPLTITDDARLPGDCPPGCSPTSLHYAGRAFDLRWPPSPANELLFVLVTAILISAHGRAIELELVSGPTDHHVHVGLKRPGVPSTLLIRTD